MSARIIHADVLDVPLDTFPHFDALITDPPYSQHVHENAASVGVAGGEGMGAHARDLGFAHLGPVLQERIAKVAASVQRWSCIFSDFEGTYQWKSRAEFQGAEYIRLVPWVRWSQPQLSGDRPPTGAEAVSIFHHANRKPKGGLAPIKKRWNGPGNLTHFSRRSLRGLTNAVCLARGDRPKHPTEKPIGLMLDLVSWFSDPGEAVIDPCAGAGTTGLACVLLGREFVGFELDETWAAQAQERVDGALSDRDTKLIVEWCDTTTAEASATPAPKAADGSDVKTWERAQRRLADVDRVKEWIK